MVLFLNVIVNLVFLDVSLDDDFQLTKKKKKKKAFDLNDMSSALPVCLMFLMTWLFLVVCLPAYTYVFQFDLAVRHCVH